MSVGGAATAAVVMATTVVINGLINCDSEQMRSSVDGECGHSGKIAINAMRT